MDNDSRRTLIFGTFTVALIRSTPGEGMPGGKKYEHHNRGASPDTATFRRTSKPARGSRRSTPITIRAQALSRRRFVRRCGMVK